MSFLFKRIVAQLIDLLLGYLLIFLVFGFVMPWLATYVSNNIIRTMIGMVLIALVYFAAQYPFMVNGQTIGKGFYHLKIISTDDIRKEVPIIVIFQREILCKLMSCFFICLPVFSGKLGGHEEATHTKVVQI